MTDKPKTQQTQDAQSDYIVQQTPGTHDAQLIADGEVLTTITGMDKLTERAKQRHNQLLAAIDPDSPEYMPEVAKAFEELRAALPGIMSDINRAAELIQELDNLEPLINAELKKDPEARTLKQYMYLYTAGELLDVLDDPNNALTKALEAARIAKAVSTNAKRAEKVDFPLDKVNSTIWGLLEKDTQGQIALKAEKAGSKDELSIFYSINFDALANVQISKRQTAFDKMVYIATAALYNAGNEWVTLTQIYYALGNDRSKKPASKHLERILDSLRKMKAADIFIDNAQEAGKYNYPSFRYEGDLLPTEKITASINGKLTDAAIHLFREPPLVTFAKQRNQVTTISVKLLAAPINKTEKHLAIQDYLLERISRAKHGTKKQERILLATLAEKAKDTTGKRGRIQEAAETYLKHFKAEAWIKGYTTDKDGITIYF